VALWTAGSGRSSNRHRRTIPLSSVLWTTVLLRLRRPLLGVAPSILGLERWILGVAPSILGLARWILGVAPSILGMASLAIRRRIGIGSGQAEDTADSTAVEVRR
jgi:hypothetical protein